MTILGTAFTAGALLVTVFLTQQALALRDHGRLGPAVVTDCTGKRFDAALELPDGSVVHATDLELASLTITPAIGARFTALYDPRHPTNPRRRPDRRPARTRDRPEPGEACPPQGCRGSGAGPRANLSKHV